MSAGRTAVVSTGHPSSLRAAVAVGALAAVLIGCSGSSGPIDVLDAPGWLGARADSHNANRTGVDGARELTAAWSRPLGSAQSAPATVAPNGQIFTTVASRPQIPGSDFVTGCTLYSFESDSGRKRFCSALGPSAAVSTPVADTVANVYAGDDSGISSFNEHGQLRWRTPVYGVPRAPQFLPDGNLLVITQFGQTNVLSTQTGRSVVPVLDLIPPPELLESPGTPLRPASDGLDVCGVGGPECAVAAAPAVDLDASEIYLVLWRDGAIAPQLVALHYDSANQSLSESWSSDLLPAAVTSSPVLSPDGGTVYLTDVEGTVRAFGAADGAPSWSYFTGHRATGSVSVTSDGTVVPAAGDGAHLQAIRNAGERPEVLWERTDVITLAPPALSAGNTGYTVTSSDSGALEVVTFDTATGDTVGTTELPGATGYAVGVAVGPDGGVVVSSGLGQLFALD